MSSKIFLDQNVDVSALIWLRDLATSFQGYLRAESCQAGDLTDPVGVFLYFWIS